MVVADKQICVALSPCSIFYTWICHKLIGSSDSILTMMSNGCVAEYAIFIDVLLHPMGGGGGGGGQQILSKTSTDIKESKLRNYKI